MAKLRRLSTTQRDFERRLKALLAFEAVLDAKVDTAVVRILAEVKARGDAALLEYTRRFDKLKAKTVRELELPRASLAAALLTLPNPQRQALEEAASRIRAYHEKQLVQSWSYRDADGTLLGQQVTSLERVGMYVPGGKAAYPSTVLMNAIPARVAGVRELIMTVPTPYGERNDLVLAAAAICGVDRVFTIGGAQAIGALAYGTKTSPQVDKIVGPGNAYVAAAKRRVYGVVGLDMVAGPSEILVICDGQTDPDWVAMDLFSQSEHDDMAQAILLSPDAKFMDAVAESIKRLLPSLPRREVIRASFEKRGALIEVKNLDEACAIANRIAPEHLELSVENAESWAAKIKNAGAIFIGRYSSEALGDYCAGPNHVLPTSRSARFSSPLGVYDFQKRSSVISISKEGAVKLGKVAVELAMGEGLQAHVRSAQYRMK
ncbi:MAG TPA: histidinol dehydrogenase [Burkholderiales bacterium]|nr:histidinol dehydrogenase [Burkholderiales bacterium]